MESIESLTERHPQRYQGGYEKLLDAMSSYNIKLDETKASVKHDVSEYRI